MIETDYASLSSTRHAVHPNKSIRNYLPAPCQFHIKSDTQLLEYARSKSPRSWYYYLDTFSSTSILSRMLWQERCCFKEGYAIFCQMLRMHVFRMLHGVEFRRFVHAQNNLAPSQNNYGLSLIRSINTGTPSARLLSEALDEIHQYLCQQASRSSRQLAVLEALY